MDELPNDLRHLIELARDEHDPPDDAAKQRVRLALVAAVGLPSAGAALGGKAAVMGKTQASLAAGKVALGTKLTALAVGALAAAGIGFAVYDAPSPRVQTTAPQAALPAPAREPEPAPVIEPRVTQLVADEPTPEPAAADRREPEQLERPSAKSRKAAPADTLGEEMALLRAASEALARGDAGDALVQLRTHAKRYPRGSLREERDGLRAIAECTQAPNQDAAQRFQQLYPNSLLAARVALACRAR